MVDTKSNSLWYVKKEEVKVYPVNLMSDKTRQITIYTWGKNFRDNFPYKLDCNFNVCEISYRNHTRDFDLRKSSGMDPDLKDRIMSTDKARDFAVSIVNKVERDNLHVIGINCSKGKHRSVSIANYLKDVYYPSATVYHYEQKKYY